MPEAESEQELLLGRFRLDRTLGAGGMATVYEAFDQTLRVTRAIKILDPAMAHREKVVQRFLSEARTMAQLRHNNIVTVYDVAVEGERPFIVMEYMKGGCLMDLVDAAGAGLDPRAACVLTAGMLRGLSCAHERGVVHRDVKPHNVLLDDDGTPKVTDFGIAQVKDKTFQQTKTGMVMGTLAYMPPEQRQSARRVDARSDVYASGATLYVLVTGEEPFDLYATEFHDRLFKNVDPRIAAVIKRACKYDMDARFETALEMAELLEALAEELGGGDGPVLAGAAPKPNKPSSLNLAELAQPSETVWMDDEDSEILETGGSSDTIAPSHTMHEAALPASGASGAPAAALPQKKSRLPLVLGALGLAAVVGGGVWMAGGNGPARPPRRTPRTAAAVAPGEPAAAEATPRRRLRRRRRSSGGGGPGYAERPGPRGCAGGLKPKPKLAKRPRRRRPPHRLRRPSCGHRAVVINSRRGP